MEYPAYTARVEDNPAYVEEVIVQSRKFEVAYTDALAASQKALDEWHTGRWGDTTRDPYPSFIANAIEELDPFAIEPTVDLARNALYRSALTLWARQGGYNASSVLTWFDDVIDKYKNLDRIPYNEPVWEGFFNTFPIELPRYPEGHVQAGKVDAEQLSDMTDLQRALITAQSAEVAHTCATGGGDDTWFDYLPAGIEALAAFQAENWAEMFADYVNTMDGKDEDEQFELQDKLQEKYNIYIMDTTTVLLTHYL